MAKQSSLLKVFDGGRLVNLTDGADNADKQPLTLFEKEALRIFNEHIALRAKHNELVKHTMWLAMEFGKVLGERAALQDEIKTLKDN